RSLHERLGKQESRRNDAAGRIRRSWWTPVRADAEILFSGSPLISAANLRRGCDQYRRSREPSCFFPRWQHSTFCEDGAGFHQMDDLRLAFQRRQMDGARNRAVLRPVLGCRSVYYQGWHSVLHFESSHQRRGSAERQYGYLENREDTRWLEQADPYGIAHQQRIE